MGQDAKHTPEPQKLTPPDIERLAQAVKDATSTTAYRLIIDADRTPGLTDTKLGGLPYWNPAFTYPATPKGQKLMLLAQLRLTDFGGDPRLPDHGLLQFFIDAEDDCSGMDFDDATNQAGFRVVWHETIDETVTEDQVRAIGMPVSTMGFDEDFLGNVVNGEFSLSVEPTTWWMTIADGKSDEVFCGLCAKLMGEDFMAGRTDWYDLLDNKGVDLFFDLLKVPEPSHVVLGYPFFTQYDPRTTPALMDEFDTLLLQIDSDGKGGKDRVLWGDVGIGGFFINGEALRRGDFSRVLFNWDCY